MEKSLPLAAALEALISIRALHSGYRQMAASPPVVHQLFLDHPALAPLRVDFARDFPRALTRVLSSL